MVYKKYIVRNGKTYGPYTYHSRRVNGKVVSDYHGFKPKTDYKRFLFPILMVVALFALVFAGVNFIDQSISGQAIFGIQGSYIEGENLDGVFKLSLKEGELLPSDSKLIFKTSSGKTYEYVLSDLVADEVIEGDFYVEGKTLEGNGAGYGVVGVKETYPEVEFVLEIGEVSENEEVSESEEENSDTETESEEEEIVEEEDEIEEEESEETEVEGEEETVEEETQEVEVEAPEAAEESEPEPAPEPEPSVDDVGITGGIIRGIGGVFNFFQSIATTTGQVALEISDEVGGVVSGDAPFNYNLIDGQTALLKTESVSTGNDNDVEVVVENNLVTVTTDYVGEEQGFGGEYLGEVGKEILIDLSLLEVIAEQGELTVEVIYGENNLVSIATELEVEGALNESEASGEFIEDTLDEILETVTEELVLTEGEIETLSGEFTNFTLEDIETTRADVVRNRLFLKHELGNYWIEYTYDYDGMNSELDEQIENDKIKWLKDLVVNLAKEESETESLLNVINGIELEINETEAVEESEEETGNETEESNEEIVEGNSSEEIEVNESEEDLTNES